MAKYAGRSKEFASRRLATSMVVFGCLTDTLTDTTPGCRHQPSQASSRVQQAAGKPSFSRDRQYERARQ